MGRVKYSDSERDKIISTFISAAREIIETEGIDKLSIRRVASFTGYSSATIYLYFPNVDALVTLACMSYLENYCRDLAKDMEKMKTNYDMFINSWEVFSRHAFSNPNIFHHLFYSPHTVPLRETVRMYYKLYPAQLEAITGPLYDMLLGGTIEERCMLVLGPMAEDYNIPVEDAEMINDISISYFRKLLEIRCRNDEEIDSAALTKKMMRALGLLIDVHMFRGEYQA